jgi:Domain of unknown function (DUF4232)
VRTAISRCGGAAAALATAAAVAACGSGGSSSSATSRPSASAPASTTTRTVTTSLSTSDASTSSGRSPRARTAALPPGCTPPHTAVSVGQVGAATGHVGLTLLFRNSGTTPCTLTGYPGAALVAATGRHRRLDIARTPQGYMGGLSPQARANPVVLLAPGHQASAILEGEDFNPQTSAACPRYSALLVTPPNQRVTVRLTRSLAICDPEIHPVVPGTTGRQRG